jgi:F-type H+-transporting ATPase subunit epsilon
MKTFTLILQDATHTERIEGITSFVGEDKSGSFGVLAGHGRMMTSLIFGMARFKNADGLWQYLALPGALLYFINNELSISTRRFLIDDNYERMSQALQEQLLQEEEELHAMKSSLQRMEDEVLKRMWEMSRDRSISG